MRGRIHPLAAGVHVGERFYRADDGVGCGVHSGGFLDDVAEGSANVTVALFEQAGGVGVAIDGAAVNTEVLGDLAEVLPVQEGLLELFLNVVAADAAVGLVEFEAGEAAGALDARTSGGAWGFRGGL